MLGSAWTAGAGLRLTTKRRRSCWRRSPLSALSGRHGNKASRNTPRTVTLRARASVASDAPGHCLRRIIDGVDQSAPRRRGGTGSGDVTRKRRTSESAQVSGRGAHDNLSELVRSVDALFARSNKDKSSALKHATPTLCASLDDLQDEVCPACASPFNPKRYDQIYCSAPCRWRAHNRMVGERRAEVRASLKCAICGSSSLGALQSARKFCDACRLQRKREREGCGRGGWRAKARKALTCTTCGAPIADARRGDQRLCASCRYAAWLENKRRHRRRLKAGQTGRRGSNQFAKIEKA